MFPTEFSGLFDQEKSKLDNKLKKEESEEKCKTVTIAKYYTSLDSLNADNDRQIYFDKKYDKTNYGILEESYSKEVITMSPEELKAFLTREFMLKKKMSLRAQNFDSSPIKVNDKLGNPIMIGGVLVWKVENTYKSSFEVDDYKNFIKVQSESAIRKLAGLYPYDNLDHEHEISLRSGGEEVNHQLEKELAERLEIAGIVVLEARISSLAYASEIAGAMLQRQQAIAMVAARQKIVEGAVGMVESALKSLSDKNIIDLDIDKKAAMISNLMVVLCSDKSATPVVNAGTLHQ
jgi:hypothetical protein